MSGELPWFILAIVAVVGALILDFVWYNRALAWAVFGLGVIFTVVTFTSLIAAPGLQTIFPMAACTLFTYLIAERHLFN